MDNNLSFRPGAKTIKTVICPYCRNGVQVGPYTATDLRQLMRFVMATTQTWRDVYDSLGHCDHGMKIYEEE